MKTKTPFFIIGSHRTGTSYLSHQLATISGVKIVFESGMIFKILEKYKLNENLPPETCRKFVFELSKNIIKPAVNNNENLENSIDKFRVSKNSINSKFKDDIKAKEFICQAYEFIQDNLVCDYLGEKDPGYRFYLNEILELFPSVKIVFIVRNPYDTILSYKFHNLKPYNYNPVFHPIMTSILLKNATMQSMEWENLHPDQILTIRFEELINDKQNSIKEVCSFLNIKINDNNPVIKGTNSSFNNIEKPKLTNIEKYYITKICKKVFENYNYNYQIVKISIFDKIKTIIELIPYSINSYRIMSTIHGNIFNFFRLRMKNK